MVTAAKTVQSPYRKKSQLARRASTSSNGKGGGKQQHFKKKTPKKHHPQKQKTYKVMFKNSVPSGAPSGGKGETGNVSNPVLSGRVLEKKVHTTGFLVMQSIVNWLRAPTLRVNPWRHCTQILAQTIGLRSLQTSRSGCQVKLVP